MKCKICGSRLTKNGDICLNCYKNLQEKEELAKDLTEKVIIKKNFHLSYEFVKYIELILIFLLATLGCITFKNYFEGFICLIALILIFILLVLNDKKIAKTTKVVFYETKVVYEAKSWLYNTEKTVKYTDLKDITYFQKARQRLFKYGDLCVYAKGTIPGVTLLNGFQVKDVENIREVINEIVTKLQNNNE